MGNTGATSLTFQNSDGTSQTLDVSNVNHITALINGIGYNVNSTNLLLLAKFLTSWARGVRAPVAKYGIGVAINEMGTLSTCICDNNNSCNSC